MVRGRSKNEKTARIIRSLRRRFKLKELLSYTRMPKATYMYWHKRFDRKNPDKEIEEKYSKSVKKIRIMGIAGYLDNFEIRDIVSPKRRFIV